MPLSRLPRTPQGFLPSPGEKGRSVMRSAARQHPLPLRTVQRAHLSALAPLHLLALHVWLHDPSQLQSQPLPVTPAVF